MRSIVILALLESYSRKKSEGILGRIASVDFVEVCVECCLSYRFPLVPCSLFPGLRALVFLQRSLIILM